MSEETQPGQAISNAVTATKVPLLASSWREEDDDKKQQIGKMQFFQNFSTFALLTFWLSHCTKSFFMASRTYRTIFKINFA